MRVTIIGLGLIGGSLGLALRRSKVAKAVIGHDENHSAARKARQLGAIDRAEWNLPAAVEKADVVIIATPVGEIKDVFSHIAPHLAPRCVVSDVASTKKQVVVWADELLPEHVSFVGGHPMAGKEKSGVEAAHPDLFVGATYCVVPGSKATQEAVDLLLSLVSAIGARPFFVDPIEHDSFVAAVSHLPFIAAVSLMNMAASSGVWRDLSRLAATGFRDMTRLASGNPTMHRDICLTNRDNILRWLDAYIAQLAEMREFVAAGDERLEHAFRTAKESRDAWLEQREGAMPVELPDGKQQMKQMLFGGLKLTDKR